MSRYKSIPHLSEIALHAKSSLHPIHTKSSRLTAYFEVKLRPDGLPDLSAPIDGTLEIDVESLKSNNKLYDQVMQDVLDTRRYPKVKVRLIDIQAKRGDGRYTAVAEVTFHGVTKRLKGDLVVRSVANKRLEINGMIELDIRDFNVKPPSLLVVKVHPGIKVQMNLIAEPMEDRR